ncbi:CbiX/SirB N-terminal domain-containing protein [Halorussus sp. AFM4]|uniref:CbiX/SirB N-terminal domain-containing protein n=1 Tax=Halorussus sp. AFM4 TaxID=3421651 RepID=UPI003EB99A90
MTDQALIIAGHGSHRNSDSATPTHVAVDAARERGAFAEVRPAFWKEAPSFREVCHTVDADEAVVVPLFVSEGYFVEQVLPREFGLGERDRGADGPDFRYADPVGTHSAMTDVIAERAKRLLSGEADDVTDDAGPVAPEDAALAVVGHGTERNPNSADAVYQHVEALRERGEFAEVDALFMDEAPYVEDVREEFDADEIAVVPLFVADGFHTQDEIPELLGLTDDPETGYPVPATVGDRRVWYASAVGTDPLVIDVVLERAAEAGADVEASAETDRPVRADAGAAFLDWVDAGDANDDAADAEAGTRVWGELAVTAAGEGYDLRHRDDRGASADDLDDLSIGDLREAVRYADDGRYRPFAGEASLPTGWVLSDLDREGLLRAAATVYPAGVEHWAADRAGDLDPVPFRAVADRQTGIYECVADCSPAEVAGAVEAVCGNCAKRRAWDAGDAESESPDCGGSPAGDEGAVPCREPCSFLVAAAREFHQHEGEPTANEDAGTSATRADPTVPRGDLTDPANRYRARYRRARETARQPTDPTETESRP